MVPGGIKIGPLMDTRKNEDTRHEHGKKEPLLQTKISVRWPVTIISGQESLEAESRNITMKGIFLQARKDLKINENYQLIVNGPQKKSVLVKGKIVWSNVDEKRRTRSLSGGGFFFIKAIREDREILKSLISDHLRS
jgi:Tfp pilus assembly protein PilZ